MALLLDWKDGSAYFLGHTVSVEEMSGGWLALLRKPATRHIDANPETKQIDLARTEQGAKEVAEGALFAELAKQLGTVGLGIAVAGATAPAAKVTTLDLVAAEVGRGRAKFPGNAHLLAALVEEVGEVARALLEGGNGPAVHGEAMQVAAVAVRIMEEGDADFPRLLSPEEVTRNRAELEKGVFDASFENRR